MKILQIIPSFAPAWLYGGPVYSVYKLCYHLSKCRHEVQVLTTNSASLKKPLDVKVNSNITLGTQFHVVYCRRWFRHSVSPFLLWIMPCWLRKSQIVHLTGVYSFPTLPCLLFCKWLNLPVIWSPRGSMQEWTGSRRKFAKALWNRIIKFVLPTHTVIHVTSKSEELECREKFPNVRYSIIPNGVDIPPKVESFQNNGPIRLLYLGRLDHKKGIENLLTACKKFSSKKNEEIFLIIAGEGKTSYVNYLRDYIKSLGLQEVVEMIGWVNEAEKGELFSKVNITVLPSYSENFGIVIAESLAHGVPVIASTGTPWQEVEAIGCGLWVENDPATLANAISFMMEQPLLSMGKKGRVWIKNNYSWPVVAEEMGRLYASLLEGEK